MPELFDMTALQQQATEKFAEAKSIAAEWKGQEAAMPSDVADHLQSLLGEVKTIRNRIGIGQDLSDLAAPATTPAGFAGARPADDKEGLELYDAKSWREGEVKNAYGEVIRYTYQVPLAVQRKGYRGSFEGYLHKGQNNLSLWDQKTLSEGTDTSGGFLVPEDVHTEIVKKIMTMAVVRQNANVKQTGRDVATFMRANYTTAADDTGGNLYTSPMRVTATGEVPASATVHQVTSTVWGQVRIPVHTVMMSEVVSNDVLEDAVVDLGAYLGEGFGEGYALYEENQFINGNGINAPMGLLTQVNTANGPTSVISGLETTPFWTYAGMINVEASLPSQYEPNAKWLARKATYSQIRSIVTATSNVPLWTPGGEGYLGPVPTMLLGYPILKSEFMPACANNAYPLLLGDFKGYQIVDRIGLSIQRLDELLADQNARKFLARKRFGGQILKPWQFVCSETEAH